MNGFTGDVYNGHKVFIRKEYESYYCECSELERLGDCLGLYFGSNYLSEALDKAEIIDLSLVYNVRKEYNEKLRNYEEINQMWVPYKCGYVHKITGEYVIGDKPAYDSYPCWCKVSNLIKNRRSENLANAAKTSKLIAGLYLLFGGKKWLVLMN